MDRKFPASSALLSTFGVDRDFRTYLDQCGDMHLLRVATLARVHDSSSGELEAIFAGEAQALSLLMTNDREAGAWLHVCELVLPDKNRTGALADAHARTDAPTIHPTTRLLDTQWVYGVVMGVL